MLNLSTFLLSLCTTALVVRAAPTPFPATAATAKPWTTSFGWVACQWDGDPINQNRLRTYSNGTLTMYTNNDDQINPPNTEKLNFSISSTGIITQAFKNGSKGTLIASAAPDLTLSISTAKTLPKGALSTWTINSNHELGVKGTSVLLSACATMTGQIMSIHVIVPGAKAPGCPKNQAAVSGPTLQQIKVSDGPGTGTCVDLGNHNDD